VDRVVCSRTACKVGVTVWGFVAISDIRSLCGII
jgi:hypothetical protein